MSAGLNSSNSKTAIGVGSALMDLLLKENDEFINATGAAKGGMTLVESSDIDKILEKTSNGVEKVPGGSACNTILGIAKLGNPTSFIGKVGKDSVGEELEKGLKANGVTPVFEKSELPTGRVLSIITPDAQRTMYTYLGAASDTRVEELTENKFQGAAVVHIEGYLLFNKDLIFKALDEAKKSGALISLDLASFTVVEAARDILEEIVRDYVDILLANEDEAKAYTGTSDESESLKLLSKDVKVAVLKVGKRGSFISYNDKVTQVGILGSGNAIDTTGAGDLWASGFLYGIINGLPIEKCGELGSACGYEVCQVIGAQIPEDGWVRIKKLL